MTDLPSGIDPRQCPGNGCVLSDRMGTCEAMSDKKSWHWCRGWSAFVCLEALERWQHLGKPGLSPQQIREALDNRRTPPAPFERRDVSMRPEIASAPSGLDQWKLYAPDGLNKRGTPDVTQQGYVRSRAHDYRVYWPTEPRRGPSMVLLGLPGTGKTLLLRILGKQAAMSGWSVMFVDWLALVERCKQTRAHQSEERLLEVVRAYIDVDLLILDDVRPIYDSQDDENIAHAIVKGRAGEESGADGRPTFVSANLTRSELSDVIGPAALSRLLGNREPIICDWPSYRSLHQEGAHV